MKSRMLFIVLGIVTAVAGGATSAHGVVYGFQGITLNDPGNVAIGEAQLSLAVTSPSATEVLFTFHNVGTGQSVIEQVFFEQGVLGSLASISNSTGVSFIQDLPGPANLPGGNSLSPQFTESFSAAANPPAPTNGVNNTITDAETLGLLFNLASGMTFADVLTGLGSSTFRVGVHVIAYSNGGSESFINGPIPPTVPEPMTAALMLAGTAFGAVARRHRRK